MTFKLHAKLQKMQKLKIVFTYDFTVILKQEMARIAC